MLFFFIFQLTDEIMFLALSIRTRIGCSRDVEKPLVWLNDCIDALAKRRSMDLGAVSFNYLMKSVYKVIVTTRVSNDKVRGQKMRFRSIFYNLMDST